MYRSLQVYHLCEDDSIIGSMFYLMEYKQGRVFWDPALPDLSNVQRGEIFDQMNQVLVALHSVDIEAVGLRTMVAPAIILPVRLVAGQNSIRPRKSTPLPIWTD